MPMDKKGHEIMNSFMSRYGKKKGKSAAYATANKKGRGSKIYAALHGDKGM